jgi:phage FluMu protein Com
MSMAIKFQCPSCGKRLRAAESDAGRKIVCPKCSTPLEVPAAAPTSAAEFPGDSAEPSAPVNPFASAKEIHVAGSSTGFATEDELPPDPEIRVRVFAPATALTAVGACGLLLRLANTFRTMFGIELPESVTGIARFVWPGSTFATLFLLSMSALLILSGHRMRNLQSYRFAVGASVLAMIPCISPCCALGLPVGIWSLTVLWNEEVKRAFRE